MIVTNKYAKLTFSLKVKDADTETQREEGKLADLRVEGVGGGSGSADMF